MAKFLDESGLSYFYGKLKSKFSNYVYVGTNPPADLPVNAIWINPSETGSSTSSSKFQIKRTDGSWGPFSFSMGNFVGATSTKAGAGGTVPGPAAGDQDKYLKANGTWSKIPQTTVDTEISSASTNPVQNKAIYTALQSKVNTSIFNGGFGFSNPGATISWLQNAHVVGSINSKNYSGTAYAATHDAKGNGITETYATKADVSGVVKSINGTNPDASGNVNITDTKVTNTLNTTAKAYITGTTSSSSNTGTQVFDIGVYLDTTAGTLVAKTFKTSTGIEIY